MSEPSGPNSKIQPLVIIRTLPELDFLAYSRISIAFEVKTILELSQPRGELGGFVLTQRDISEPYSKDYDSIPGNHPTDWPESFEILNWGMLAAESDGIPVGGAVIAFRTPGLRMLEGREDVAAIWDIRVSPEWRGKGIGGMLFGACLAWAQARGCGQIHVETQNINVPACLFYLRHDCVLGCINRLAYPALPEEIQLIWYREL